MSEIIFYAVFRVDLRFIMQFGADLAYLFNTLADLLCSLGDLFYIFLATPSSFPLEPPYIEYVYMLFTTTTTTTTTHQRRHL